jgi:alpha-N-arabinofuranosidase
MIYGHFIEHFHWQIYGGVFDPGNPLSDDGGFRTDVIEALRHIKTPVLRWPGGCFVSAHHWKDAVGPQRIASFDKAWRVEEPNTFGTDEYIAFCRKLGCEPYICTNAGSGGAEEMSDWVEYCNLPHEGLWARQRIANENYFGGEIGAKSSLEWGRLVPISRRW